jgi:hypothetical protein
MILQMKNARKKKILTENIPTDLFRLYFYL